MSYGEGSCRIERHANGWEVTMRDPAIVKANRVRDRMKYDDPKRGEYRDPNISMVFTKEDEVLSFLKKNLKKMEAEADFDTSFDLACCEPDEG